MPVLFLPGNAGSHQQVRSLAAESARQTQRAQQAQHAQQAQQGRGTRTCAAGGEALGAGGEPSCGPSAAGAAGRGEDGGGDCQGIVPELAWFSADFKEELSAFDGALLVWGPGRLRWAALGL